MKLSTRLYVGFSEGGGQLVDLGLRVCLPLGGRRLGVVPPCQGFVGSLEKLLLLFGDRRLGHLQSPACLHLGLLSPQHADHDGKLLFGCLVGLPPHPPLPWSRSPELLLRRCPKNLDPRHVTFTYDQANRLTAYGTTATYAYDGDGLRMSKTVSGTTSASTWDMAEGLPLLLADGFTDYVYGPSELPLEQVSSSGTLYYHQDQLGSTRALTNASGSVVATYTYDPYGRLTASTGTASNPFGYAGQYSDAESGLIYLRARYYDPATGQFLSRDPLVAITKEAYGYGRDNPLNEGDPTGLGGAVPGVCLFGQQCTDPCGRARKNMWNSGATLPNWFLYGYGGLGAAGGGALLFVGGGEVFTAIVGSEALQTLLSPAAETEDGGGVDVGHAGIHQFPGVTAGKSQFYDGVDLGALSDTEGAEGVLQKNGNTRFVLRAPGDIDVDRTTGLPTDVYTVIRMPDGSVLTMFPGTTPKS